MFRGPVVQMEMDKLSRTRKDAGLNNLGYIVSIFISSSADFTICLMEICSDLV
jgi:hypothetical protein